MKALGGIVVLFFAASASAQSLKPEVVKDCVEQDKCMNVLYDAANDPRLQRQAYPLLNAQCDKITRGVTYDNLGACAGARKIARGLDLVGPPDREWMTYLEQLCSAGQTIACDIADRDRPIAVRLANAPTTCTTWFQTQKADDNRKCWDLVLQEYGQALRENLLLPADKSVLRIAAKTLAGRCSTKDGMPCVDAAMYLRAIGEKDAVAKLVEIGGPWVVEACRSADYCSKISALVKGSKFEFGALLAACSGGSRSSCGELTKHGDTPEITAAACAGGIPEMCQRLRCEAKQARDIATLCSPKSWAACICAEAKDHKPHTSDAQLDTAIEHYVAEARKANAKTVSPAFAPTLGSDNARANQAYDAAVYKIPADRCYHDGTRPPSPSYDMHANSICLGASDADAAKHEASIVKAKAAYHSALRASLAAWCPCR
ncbi:MAG: hypothetical protein IT381_03360 [Deltaproteobacteria bacterium]|nr:hypothetical protein [Deltaproteobacteria bacterium]